MEGKTRLYERIVSFTMALIMFFSSFSGNLAVSAQEISEILNDDGTVTVTADETVTTDDAVSEIAEDIRESITEAEDTESETDEAIPETETAADTSARAAQDYTAETADGTKVTAQVSPDAFDGEAVLTARYVAETEAAYQTAVDALDAEGAEYRNAVILDVHFEVDGTETEPKEGFPVQVSFEFPKAVVEEITDGDVENADVEIHHITDDGAETVADSGSIAVADETVSAEFEVETFSYYALTVAGETETLLAAANTGVAPLDATNSTNKPTTVKTVEYNNDGTYTVTLSVSADPTEETKIHKANVTIIVDTSNSMKDSVSTVSSYKYTKTTNFTATGTYYGIVDGEYVELVNVTKTTTSGGGHGPGPGGGQTTTTHDYFTYNGITYEGDVYTRSTTTTSSTRLAEAKTSVNSVIDTLLALNTNDAGIDDLVEISLINFSNYKSGGTVIQSGFTNSRDTLHTKVNALSSSSGTNWEMALKVANGTSADSKGTTLSYGDRTGDTYTNYVIFVTDGDPSYYGASDSGNLDDSNIENYNQATDDAKAIVDSGKVLYGIGVYGTVANLHSLIKYAYNTSADLEGDKFFNASDTASLNTALSSIASAIQDSISYSSVVVDDGVTSLTSVASVNGTAGDFTYTATNKSGDAVTTSDTKWQNASYADNSVTWNLGDYKLEKGVTYSCSFTVWPSQAAYDLIADLNNGVKSYDSLDSSLKSQIVSENGTYSLKTNTTLTTSFVYADTDYISNENAGDGKMTLSSSTVSLKKRWENSLDAKGEGATVGLTVTKDGADYMSYTLSSENSYTVDGIYIAPGVIRDGKVLETGHDYSARETTSDSYYWEVSFNTLHPMVIDGTLTMLELNDSATGTEGTDYYTISGHKYAKTASRGGDAILATNTRRSNLNISKAVTTDDGVTAPDSLFTYTITIKSAKEYEGEDNTVWFSVYDSNAKATVTDLDTSAAAMTGDDAGYYTVASGTAFTVSLKAGWNLRVINLLSGSTYSVEESASMPAGYTLDGVTADTDTYSISGSKATGTIDEADKSYNVRFTNRYTATSVAVTKVWDDNGNQDGVRPESVTFTLKAGNTVVSDIILDGTADENGEVTGWKAEWDNLPKYDNGTEIVYTVTETSSDSAYTVSYGDGAAYAVNNGTITNKHTPATKSVTVTKAWNDDDVNGADGYTRPASVTVKIVGKTADGTTAYAETSKTVTAGADGNWTVTFDNLPVYKAGEEITYTASEVVPDGYTAETDGYTITNTPSETEKINPVTLEIVKTDAAAGGPLSGATFTAYVGDAATSVTGTTGADGKATLTFTEKGTYTIKETAPEGYAAASDFTVKVNQTGIVKVVKTTDSENKTVFQKIYDLVFPEKADYENGTLTVTNTPSVTSVKVTKVWNDADNQDGIRGEYKVTLYKTVNGTTKSVDTQTMRAADTGYEWTNLPAYENGWKVTYSVDETKVPDGYTKSVTGTAADGFTITNTHSVEKKTITVTKVWDDQDNQDNVRPASVKFTVTGSDGKAYTATLTGTGSTWTADVEVEAKSNGQDVTFTADEESVSGYSKSISGLTITNKHEVAKKTITVTKIWADQNNQDNVRPASVKFTVTGSDGKKYNATLTGTGNTWTADVTVEAKSAGEDVTFTAAEETVDGYEPTQTDALTITNTHAVEKKTITVTKVWVDEDNQDAIRPSSVKFTVTGSDGKKYNATLTGTGDTWTADVEVEAKADGEDVTFTVDETDVDGYKKSIDNDALTITNTHAVEKKTITVTKVWVDQDNQDAVRPSSVNFTVTGSDGNTYPVTVTGTGNTWTADVEVEKLAGGRDVTFTVDEAAVTDYTKSVDNNTLTVTNTHTVAKKTITVTKVWDDEDNQDNIRPSSVDFTVTGSDSKTYSATLTGTGNTWTKDIEVEAKSAGKDVTFTVDEAAVTGYTKSVDNNTLTVTNKHAVEKKTITVTKVWVDEDNQDAIRPASVNFTVTGSDGNTYPVTLKGDGNTWTADVEVEALSRGREVTFTVNEDAVAGYEKSIDNGTLTITNTHAVETKELTVTKVWDDANNQDKVRPSSVNFTVTGSDGNTYPVEVKGTGNTWTAKVTVEAKSAGKDVTFEVSEDKVANYEATVNNDTLTITNRHDVETDEIEVVKIWDDQDNQDAVRPDSVKYTVTGSDGKKYTTTLSADNAADDANTWSKKIKVEKYADGNLVTFTVAEDAVTGYKGTTSGLTITNKHQVETKELTVTKVWDDQDNQDNVRPSQADFTVTGSDGKTYPVTVTGTGNTWTAKVTVEAKSAGRDVTFTVDEADVADYGKTINNDTLTITNKHEVAKKTITVTKVWVDRNNQDNVRPDSVKFTVTGSDKKTYTATLTGTGNTWTADIEVEKLSKGSEVTFKVDEDAVADYEKTIDNDTLTITNKHEVAKKTITVTKVWEDRNNQDNVRPSSVNFTVTGSDGKTYPVTVTGTGNTWTADVEVEELSGGNEVTFTVDEADVADYEKTISGLTITNKHEVAKNEITVTKVWDDNSDQDGKRPDSVDFTVTGSDSKTYSATLTGTGNTWTAKVTVEKFAGGEPVTFTVDEAAVAEYDKTISGLTITNTHEPEKTDVTVTKVWDDNSDQDGKRPDSLALTLKADGVAVNGARATVTKNGNSWTYTWKDVDKYADGSVITYTAEETVVPDLYTCENTTAAAGGTITNSHDAILTSVTAAKVWDDANNQDGKRPDSLTLTLLANGVAVTDVTPTVTKDGNRWTYTWTDVEMYAGGREVTYEIREKSIPAGYTCGVTTVAAGGTITNRHTPEVTDVTVTKTWTDADNQDGKRDTYGVTLYADGEAVGSEVKLDKDTLTYTWNDVPVYKDGTKITYTVAETTVPDEYEASVNGFAVTNSHTPEETTVTVTKTWNDNDNQDGMRGTYGVTLYADGEAYGSEVKLDAGTLTYTWENLPVYKDGAKITYTVDETTIPENYTASVTGNAAAGFAVTNSHTPEETTVTVTKTWDDGDNQDGIRASYGVTLYADGEAVGSEVTLDKDTLTYTWSNLPVYKDGAEITYTVDETSIPDGYNAAVTGDAETGFAIINSHTPEETTVTVTKTWDDGEDKEGIRPESVTFVLSDGDSIVLDGTPDESGESARWTATFEHLPKYSKGTLIEYTVTESDVDANYTVTYEDGASYATDGETITNSHVPSGYLTVEKHVKSGDKTRLYAFELKVSDSTYNLNGFKNGYKIFTLKDGQSITIAIPEGLTYSLREVAPGYITRSTNTSGTIEVGETVTSVFDNYIVEDIPEDSPETSPDTGDDTMNYAVISVITLAAAAFVVFRRKSEI